MKKIFYLVLVIGLVFWSCSDDSLAPIQQFELPELDGNPVIKDSNYGVDYYTSDGWVFDPGYESGLIRSDRVKLELSNISEEFLFYDIYKATGAFDEVDVFYGEEDNTWSFESTVNDSGITAYWDSSLTSNSKYTYKIITVSEQGTYQLDEVWIKTPQWEKPSEIIFNPLSLSIAELTWQDNSESEMNFQITKNNEDVIEVEANTISYIFDNLDVEVPYYFEIYGTNIWEQTESGNTTNNYIVFDAPSGLTATSSNSTVSLSWDDNSNVETGFKIERQIIDDFLWDNVGSTSNPTYTDDDIEVGEEYTYRVSAYNNYDEYVETDWVESNIVEVIAEIAGCMDIQAENYNEDAAEDDGSCEYLGCTDPSAVNYDSSATNDDGSCIYANHQFYDFEDGTLGIMESSTFGVCNAFSATDDEAFDGLYSAFVFCGVSGATSTLYVTVDVPENTNITISWQEMENNAASNGTFYVGTLDYSNLFASTAASNQWESKSQTYFTGASTQLEFSWEFAPVFSFGSQQKIYIDNIEITW